MTPAPTRDAAPETARATAGDGARPPVTAWLDPSEPSLAYLGRRLEVVEACVGLAVARMRAAESNPDDRFRGLYVTGERATELLAADRARPAPDESVEKVRAGLAAALVEAERRADDAEARGSLIRLRALARAFGLAPVDVELLLVAFAPELDSRFERLYGYLNDDVSRRHPSVGLAMALCGLPAASGPARARLRASGPLVGGGLLLVEGGERPFLGRSVRVADRVAGYLLGDDTPDPVLARVASTGPAAPTQSAEQLERGLRAGATLAYLHDRVGSDGRGVAAEALARLAGPALVLDLELVAVEPDVSALAAAAGQEARLRGTGIVAGPAEAVADKHPGLLRELAALPCPVILHGTKDWDPAWSRKVPLLLDARPLTPDRRSNIWRAALEGVPEADAVATEVARYPFRVAPEAIARAVAIGRLSAAAAGSPVQAADLAMGVRAQNATGLQALARRIEPRSSWKDLVLLGDTIDQLHDLANRALYRDQVLDGWGLGDPNRGRGLTVLFTGDSGTGKTLSAEVLAGVLGLDLYLIDLSSVVDKYIGETEKNLDRVFSQADGVNGVLLFDEADAIFGKRSEVKDSRDRYANIEIAYLLQRMERFDGMAILTTNLRANLDDAFLRRLDVLVDFPMPEEPERRRLWVRHLPSGMPVADDIDLDFLAKRFRISGGSIRNIVGTAAYNAAADGRPVSMADLIKGTEREYRKLGHLSTEAEFGPYYRQTSA
jgi:hypothetical protein